MKAPGSHAGLQNGDDIRIVRILENYFPVEYVNLKQYEDAYRRLTRILSYSRRRPEMEAMEPPEFESVPSKNVLISSPEKINIPQMRGNVLIKPNLVQWGKYPETVSPDILDAVAESVLDMGSRAAIGDGPSLFFDPEAALGKIRYVERRYGIPVLNMNSGEFCRVRVKNPLECEEIDIHSSVTDFDYLISISQVKGHNSIGYSGAMKNVFGLLAEHERLVAHRRGKECLKRTVVDAYRTLTPTLNIVDGRKLLASSQQRDYGGYEIDGFGILVGSDGERLDREAFRQYSLRVTGVKEEHTYLAYAGR
jgi:uncharacterized protein (DUF362 family)